MVSKPWSETTRRWVVVGLVVAGALVVYRIRGLLPPVILACLLAYLLGPVVERWTRLRLSRTKATLVTYLLLLVALAVAASILVPMIVQQISSINVDLHAIYESMVRIMSSYQTITIFEYTIELSDVWDKLQDSLLQLITGFASRSAQQMLGIAFGLASGFASTFVWLIFTLVVSFWLLKDSNQIGRFFYGLVTPGYRVDAGALLTSIGAVWDSFFRGLLLLSLTVGVMTGVLMWLLGVKNALLLGILAGVLEVVPTIGPIIACIPAVAIAYFQGSTYLPLGNGWFALLVLGVYVLVQQVENNLLAPRIIGGSVRIHPLIVMMGAIAGYAVGGIVGAFLAAPVIGTLKVLGQYTYRKLTEVETPAELTVEAGPPEGETRTERSDGGIAEPGDADS